MSEAVSEIANILRTLENSLKDLYSLVENPVREIEGKRIDVLGQTAPERLKAISEDLEKVLNDVYGPEWKNYLKVSEEGIEVSDKAPRLFKQIYANIVAKMLSFRNYLKSYIKVKVEELNTKLEELTKQYEASKNAVEGSIKAYEDKLGSTEGALSAYLKK